MTKTDLPVIKCPCGLSYKEYGPWYLGVHNKSAKHVFYEKWGVTRYQAMKDLDRKDREHIAEIRARVNKQADDYLDECMEKYNK